MACGISAKRQKSPLVLSPEQVKLGLAELEFRDQLLVFLEEALGIRQGELGALRWFECDSQNISKTKRSAQEKLVDAILPTGILPKTNLIQ